MKRVACAVWVMGALSGCTIFAAKSDYADYRTIRLATDTSERAVAMRTYIDKHPHGQWRDEIEAERKSQELKTFEAGKDSRKGLEYYLQAYPDGTYVSQARSRLDAIALIEQQRKQAKEQAAVLAETRKQRAQELRRTWLGRFMGYWIDTLVSLRGWGEPIPAVANSNPQFSRAFGALPRPRCTQDECVKYYASAYAVPVPGGNRIERNLSLLLRLRMRSGKLERAELLLPERGFSRWYELEERRAVSSGERGERERAVEWAIKRALPLIEQLSGGVSALAQSPLPTIEQPAIGPTGELIDTSIENPSDPQNNVQHEDNAGIGVAVGKPNGPPTTSDLVKPQAPASTPDMVFDALGVSKQGQRVEAPQTQANPARAADGGSTSEMTFATPLDVPKTGPGDAQNAAAAAPADPSDSGTPLAPVVRSFQTASGSGLQITLFAAGSEGPGYDGIVIERVNGKKLAAAKLAPPKPASPPPAAAATAPAKPATATPPTAAPSAAAATKPVTPSSNAVPPAAAAATAPAKPAATATPPTAAPSAAAATKPVTPTPNALPPAAAPTTKPAAPTTNAAPPAAAAPAKPVAPAPANPPPAAPKPAAE